MGRCGCGVTHLIYALAMYFQTHYSSTNALLNINLNPKTLAYRSKLYGNIEIENIFQVTNTNNKFLPQFRLQIRRPHV